MQAVICLSMPRCVDGEERLDLGCRNGLLNIDLWLMNPCTYPFSIRQPNELAIRGEIRCLSFPFQYTGLKIGLRELASSLRLIMPCRYTHWAYSQ